MGPDIPPDTPLYERPRIKAGIARLKSEDPVFKRLDPDPADVLWSYMGPGYGTLIRIIIGQQVSVAAARSLWAKFQGHFEDVTPEAILKTPDETFRTLGLSRQKVQYINILSEAIASGALDLEELNKAAPEDVRASLTALKGFGAWSANMYLLFALGRPDIWAPGDLGIKKGMQRYLDLPQRPSRAETETFGERFKPDRTAACLLLWTLS